MNYRTSLTVFINSCPSCLNYVRQHTALPCGYSGTNWPKIRLCGYLYTIQFTITCLEGMNLACVFFMLVRFCQLECPITWFIRRWHYCEYNTYLAIHVICIWNTCNMNLFCAGHQTTWWYHCDIIRYRNHTTILSCRHTYMGCLALEVDIPGMDK